MREVEGALLSSCLRVENRKSSEGDAKGLLQRVR